MAVILNQDGQLYEQYTYTTEKEFEKDIVKYADSIFGISSIYVDVKKRVKGNNIVTIPDGYVIDMADITDPKLFVVENEIVGHDPFSHIGIQMLKFVTSFDDGKLAVRNFLMEEINKDKSALEILEKSAKESGARNVDNYLDKAVYSEFRGLVIIDEAREELHQVLRRIAANISVLEFKSYISANGQSLVMFDTLYDEYEETGEDVKEKSYDPVKREQRKKRRAKSDTIIVPAREEGFNEVFLGENQWYSIRIGAAMKEKLKYIAAYQVAPVSAVTHIAEIEDIKPYKDTGKYRVIFKGPAKEIKPIPVSQSKNAPQSITYVRYEDLISAKALEDAIKKDRALNI